MFKIKSGFVNDSIWALFGNVIYRGSSVVSTILLARILQKISYGEFNSLKNTLTTLAVFTTFGLGYTSTKYIAECVSKYNSNPRSLINKIYKIAIIFSGLVAVCLFLFADKIALLYYNNLSFIFEIRILGLWVILMAVSTTQNGVISGLKIYKELATANIIIGVATLIITPLLAYFYGIVGACISLIVIQLIISVLYFFLIHKKLKSFSLTNDYSVSVKQILFYSLPLTLIEAIFSIGLWINYYVIQHNYDYGELALYSTAMQWYILLLFIPVILKNVILSHFSSDKKVDDGNLFRRAILMSFLSTILPAAVLLIGADVFSKMYGEGFYALGSLFRITALISIFASVIGVVEQYLFSISKNWFVFFICIFKDIGTCLLFIYFVFVKYVAEASYFLMLSYLILNASAFFIYLLLYYFTDLFPKLQKRVIS